MKRFAWAVIALLPAATLVACGGPKVMVPPRIDLRQHEILGIIEFRSSNEGELGPLATQKFTEAVRRDQGLVRIVALGTEAEALREAGSRKLDRVAYQSLGQKQGLSTIFTGELVVSDIRPTVRVTPDLRNAGVSADIDATLTAQMIETASGASIWSRSASVTMRVGDISMLGGRDVVFDAEDPERAYGPLVETLVERVTREFQATWERR